MTLMLLQAANSKPPPAVQPVAVRELLPKAQLVTKTGLAPALHKIALAPITAAYGRLG